MSDHFFSRWSRRKQGLETTEPVQPNTDSSPGVAVGGVYQGRLSNGGERVALVHATGTPLLEVTYGVESPWPPAADGQGFSLVPISPNDQRRTS
jgi:hypothetical protein